MMTAQINDCLIDGDLIGRNVRTCIIRTVMPLAQLNNLLRVNGHLKKRGMKLFKW